MRHAPGEEDAEPAEDTRRGELGQREREAAACREEAKEDELGGGRGGERREREGELGAARRPREAHAGEERRRGERTPPGSPRGRAPSGARTVRACRPATPTSARSASAIPSANGNAPERMTPAQTTANERFAQREAGPHSRAEIDAERERRSPDAGDGEQLDPDERRERVVQKAVGDEAVAPRVPEVVPDPEPVDARRGSSGTGARRSRCPAGRTRRETRPDPPRPPPRRGSRGGSPARSGRSMSCAEGAGAPAGS